MDSANVPRGAIRHRERYSQGYDHSEWGRILPRKITPSDVDVVFDNMLNARQMFCEFTSSFRLWSQKPRGQRLLYQQLLSTSNYQNASVLCYHEVEPSRNIRTAEDVISFHVMRKVNGRVCLFPEENRPYRGENWIEFVKSFYGVSEEWQW